MMERVTNVDDFISELGAGIFKEKLAHILSQSAMGTILHGDKAKKGKVSIDFTFKRVGDNDQVIISHKLSHITPTKRGKQSEEDVTETPMFVGKGGVLTINQPKEDLSGQFTLQEEGIRSVK
ncbi:hypothetical protein F9L16_23030 [Agarivorans sp. B2Z047]|uniref:hypothetical protein n=1 Tax=Agarivorans sp. B2Z047 TaxID=2652721 RepID=UPI00128DBDD3|nr:hypothetical protein [Agarivorans sp. B2Z047]MPW31843.1 hypothetical protein [Agarivorans sp. B2Z047]UQN41917.1 hypothetical protein LQZ07_19375 [Agarivorans sp. B2Z047]